MSRENHNQKQLKKISRTWVTAWNVSEYACLHRYIEGSPVHTSNCIVPRKLKLLPLQFHPSKFFSAIQSYCSRLPVSLLSYDSRSNLLRLDRRKKIGRAQWDKMWKQKIPPFASIKSRQNERTNLPRCRSDAEWVSAVTDNIFFIIKG